MKYLLCVVAAYMLSTFTLSNQEQVVKIGAIFFKGEDKLLNAFETALYDINVQALDVQLEAHKHFINVDDSVLLQDLTCDLIGNGVAAIFGPSSKASSDIVRILCNITGIPHLQFDWHTEENSAHRKNHNMTVNLAPLQHILSSAFYDVLRYKDINWRSFTIVYENDQGLARLQPLFSWVEMHDKGIRIKKFNRDDDFRVLWKLIYSSRERYVVLDCSPDMLVTVLNASIGFNMTGPFNNFFLTNLDTHTTNLAVLNTKRFRATTHAIKLLSFLPPPVLHEFDVFEEEEVDEITSMRSQLIYDAVVLFFNAVRSVIHQALYFEPKLNCKSGYWSPGPHVVYEMIHMEPKNVTPNFKTQKIHFNEQGERDDFNLEVYDPLNNVAAYVWNKERHIVDYSKMITNSTQQPKKRQKLEEVKNVAQRRNTYAIATRSGKPYFFWRQPAEGQHFEGNERFEGYIVDLIFELSKICHFDFTFEPVPDNNYGSYNEETDEWDGIIREIIDGNAQMGVCDLTITQERKRAVDFTAPFMQLGVGILYYRAPPPKKELFDFISPYKPEVWFCFLLAILVNTLLVVLLARISISEWENPQPTDNPDVVIVENHWHIGTALWWNVGTFIGGGCDILPKSATLRFYSVFVFIFVMLISKTYDANYSAHITSKRFDSSLKNLHSLVEQDKIQYGTLKGGSTAKFFSDSNESDYRVAWNKMKQMKPDAFTKDNEEGVERVKRSQGAYAFLMETTGMHYAVKRDCDVLMKVGPEFSEKHYGIAVPLNANYRSNLSVGILQLSEKGKLYEFKKRWFDNPNDTKSCDSGKPSGQYDMGYQGGIFIVGCFGFLVAIVVGICEFLWNIQKIAVEEGIPRTVALKAELRFFFHCNLRTKPLRTYAKSRGSTSTGYSSYDKSSSITKNTKHSKKSKKKKDKP